MTDTTPYFTDIMFPILDAWDDEVKKQFSPNETFIPLSSIPDGDGISLEDYSNEGFLDRFSFVNYFTAFMGKFTEVFTGHQFVPTLLQSSELRKAIGYINKSSKETMDRFTIYSPEYVSGQLSPYAITLSEVLLELVKVEQQMLIPLEQWAAHMLTDPEFKNKLWFSLPAISDKVQKNKDTLQGYFNASVNDGTASRLFKDAYVDTKGLSDVDMVLESMIKTTATVLDGKLLRRANSVASLMRQVQEKDKKDTVAGGDAEAYKNKLIAVQLLVRQAAEELELLAVVLFQIKVATYAHKQSIDKINKYLS